MKRTFQTLLSLILLFCMVSCGYESSENNITTKSTVAVQAFEKETEWGSVLWAEVESFVPETATPETFVLETFAPDPSTFETDAVETAVPTSNPTQSSGNLGVTVPDHEETEGNLVWVPVKGGKKYHCKSTCSGMDNPMQVTVEIAIANGYTPCKRCYE